MRCPRLFFFLVVAADGQAAHGLLDSVKAVLEQSGDFGAEDFWACATQIEEVTPLLASLLMSMRAVVLGHAIERSGAGT